ncbi:transposase [Microbispora bryophytorum]|uniref:helix-turn-helix domain-containing protein n=1 Tax=Microbispora bryophytorum TaxID=1460882 RepID=UPI0037108839
MMLLSAQGMPVAKIAQVAFTSEDRVRDVIHNFNADGFDSLCPKYKGGRKLTFTLPQRVEIKKIAKSKLAEHGLPFSRWSLTKLADFLVAEGVVEDISHEGLRELLRAESVSFQAISLPRSGLRGEESPRRASVRDRRPAGDPRVRRTKGAIRSQAGLRNPRFRRVVAQRVRNR